MTWKDMEKIRKQKFLSQHKEVIQRYKDAYSIMIQVGTPQAVLEFMYAEHKLDFLCENHHFAFEEIIPEDFHKEIEAVTQRNYSGEEFQKSVNIAFSIFYNLEEV